MHEAQQYENNCFITLTYAELPENGSLNKEHYTLFMKRLRKNSGAKIRFFQCGEYGEQFKRPITMPFYSGMISRISPCGKSRTISPLYTSPFLSETWGHGFCSIGQLTFESAAYVARYVVKKVTGDLAEQTLHYWDVDYDTGEAIQRIPEYVTMSRNKGIGHAWYKKYGRETFFSDSVVVNGKEQKPPNYYTSILKAEDPDAFAKLKKKRLRYAQTRKHDTTPRRLRDRETVRKAAITHLHRTFEDEEP